MTRKLPGRVLVERAQQRAEEARRRQAEIIAQLPDIRNPEAKLRKEPPQLRKAPHGYSARRQAEAIRERAQATKLASIGRSRRELLHDVASSSSDLGSLIRSRLNAGQWAEFVEHTARIASGSYQSIAILFEYAGGQNAFNLAIDRILYPIGDADEGLDLLATLAERAAQAKAAYSPAVIGRLNV